MTKHECGSSKRFQAKEAFHAGDAEKIAELSQPTVSHHLKILTDAGLLIAKKHGRYITVTVNKKALAEFTSAVSGSIKLK